MRSTGTAKRGKSVKGHKCVDEKEKKIPTIKYRLKSINYTTGGGIHYFHLLIPSGHCESLRVLTGARKQSRRPTTKSEYPFVRTVPAGEVQGEAFVSIN